MSDAFPIAKLWRLALGDGIVDWCNRTAPDLMSRYDKAALNFTTLQDELDKDLSDLSLEMYEGSRADELQRLVSLSERMLAMLERQVSIHHKLTGGGAAAVWVGMQRSAITRPMDDGAGPAERDATPRRRLSSGAQVIDA